MYLSRVRVRGLRGSVDHPLEVSLPGRFAVIAVNAPYVPTGAIALMPPEARLHEAQTWGKRRRARSR